MSKASALLSTRLKVMSFPVPLAVKPRVVPVTENVPVVLPIEVTAPGPDPKVVVLDEDRVVNAPVEVVVAPIAVELMPVEVVLKFADVIIKSPDASVVSVGSVIPTPLE